ncbi:unnamed protein product (macronuclear) [Paramecium tetraurelia]|uniref:RRM domain-containing protein n=1 Tax=Paramecium tetraurelia TaxID=5888 RepID=A0CQ98_PARTE|nr:uncharacterized protein GSPATT00009313001 [Paramecium tetraurelia]CAK72965.1 unnamed protein product [Paramecium tetraurelia]|eukprot:XP_001440362.1 hypothetical protein (macronuclear) [Paramecium tetraurelia strain d4-2]
MEDELIWYYVDTSEQETEKQTKGPISIRDIDVMLRTSIITSHTYVYKEGFTDWKPIFLVEELKSFLDEQEHEMFQITCGKEIKSEDQQAQQLQQQNEKDNEAPVEELEDEESFEQLNDEQRMEILKKKIEKNRKKSQKEKEKKKNQWYTPKINTNVYVEGLPQDITMEEMKVFFSKAGIIRINPETLQPTIKIYRDQNGNCKGDGLISYKMVESVQTAREMLDGLHIRPDVIVKVTEAVFEQKGQYRKRENKKVDKLQKALARQKEMTQMAEEGQEDDGKGLKILIFKNLYSPTQAQNPEFMNQLYGELLLKIESLQIFVQKLEFFKDHPQGVCKVRFHSSYDAEICLTSLSGIEFNGRKIHIQYWDGKENFKSNIESKEVEEQRLEEFGQWLEGQEDSDKDE